MSQWSHGSISSRSSSRSSTSSSDHNEVMLTCSLLWTLLNDLSTRLLRCFGRQVRLVVHGGVIMVMHPKLASRPGTRDVDYNHRSFVSEWQRKGVYDAGERLKSCIASTAFKFNLGADWMNACADVALPMSIDKYGQVYDPIWADAISPQNRKINTIFSQPGLELIGVSWSWAVALKLVRYQKYDPHDIAHILHLGRRQKGVQWTRHLMEEWLVNMCGAMGYHAYPSWQMEATRQKMRHAITLSQSYA
ncbi:uncharacterized protein C8Q71DRAFT_702063 [Rhodofomes roseus]|uniref:Uncharacterized protein n=2 Tax=Rhodofomes roseus TaxID=34475 RepID=A0ABQ8KR35_9APHY|nr:uncharacterized protein C8Q71DRAFT_702063 [Rhodofomes roseus]KAH9841083.1 hypothetical protein C8Q71DRAFT_702063 [Rhodofomes roseus]